MSDVQEIVEELTKRAAWHPQSSGRGSRLCSAGSHSQLENVPCSHARPLKWLYDMLEHPLGPCPRCSGYGWVYGDGKQEFEPIDCPRCAGNGLRGPTSADSRTRCPKCGVEVTDQTPSSFYPEHDKRCGGPLDEPSSSGDGS